MRTGDSPVFVSLAWRADAQSQIHDLGVWRLDLPALLEAGYIRPERAGSDAEVRVRVYRADDGLIYLQSKRDAPGLAITRAPI